MPETLTTHLYRNATKTHPALNLLEPEPESSSVLFENPYGVTDALWLRTNRQQVDMTQSNIVTYLEMTTGLNVNPGRVAEIETGQRVITPEWREKLEYLFGKLNATSPPSTNWRQVIFSGGRSAI